MMGHRDEFERSGSEGDVRPMGGRESEQSEGFSSSTSGLEREIKRLTSERQELQTRLLRLQREQTEKYDSLASSVTFRLGEAMVAAATSVRGAIALPRRLWRIYKDYRFRESRRARARDDLPGIREAARSGARGISPGESAGLSSQPVLRTEARILFLPTNGGGLGHVTRLLAIARRLKTDARIGETVFFTTSAGLNLLRKEGFTVYHHPPWDQLRGTISARGWRTSFENLAEMILRNHDIDVLLFDGVSLGQIAPVVAQHRRMRTVWIRRLMLKENREEVFNEHAWLAHLQLCPGELGQGEITRDSQGRVFVPPTIMLDRSELLPRKDAVEELGLDQSRKTLFIQLGAGNINDIETQIEIVVEIARQFAGLQVVLAESPVSHGKVRHFKGVKTVRDYPLSRYYQAFDVAVSAAGYNTVAELAYFGVPSILIPNLETGSDDQLGRALVAQQMGVSLVLNPLTASGLKHCLQKLMDDAVNAQYRERCGSLCSVNGSDVAVEVLTAFLFERTNRHWRSVFTG